MAKAMDLSDEEVLIASNDEEEVEDENSPSNHQLGISISNKQKKIKVGLKSKLKSAVWLYFKTISEGETSSSLQTEKACCLICQTNHVVSISKLNF